ncbi:MAG: Unknown protein [uncultured Sulfurovum sp.]|uniref:Lipoprotein n=1 Tax=uncultured Sulfurovum sp. TaxID=269237 RepID=A0A6S6SGF5_9BACT|nr:MAG: Unknown protein [uncultured Sulfurovum sp.]
MKKTNLKYLVIPLFLVSLLGCIKHDQKNLTTQINNNSTTSISKPQYGEHTDQIQEFLANSPIGSEIYLEEKEHGEWYLKIEKTFNVKKDEEKTKTVELIYVESILI